MTDTHGAMTHKGSKRAETSSPQVNADLIKLCDQLIALHEIITDQRRDLTLIDLRVTAMEKAQRKECKCDE